MSVLDRLARVQAARPQGGAFQRVRGIFHTWKAGKNHIRLAGDFTEVRTHFLAPSPKRKDRGLCQATAFQGDDKIPQVINCPNWDIAMERPKKEKSCPICKLNAVARAVLAEKPADPEEKAFFEALRSATRATSTLKWNIIDRDDPNVEVEGPDGKPQKVLGFKIASIGPEAARDILGIFQQVQADIQDPDTGIDIEVTRDDSGARTSYSARAVIAGTSLKVTPFTKEERALALHDLKVRCGRQTDPDDVLAAMHEDLRQLVETDVKDSDDVDAAVQQAVEEVSAAPAPAPAARPAPAPAARPAPAAPTAARVPASVLDRLQKRPATPASATAPVDAPADEDSLPLGEDLKKKVTAADADAPDQQSSEQSVPAQAAADYVCFGTIDETHPECKACQFNQQCAVEKAKKGK